tara:strand:- start:627 stop:1040 length:414 start_codon:yes stop_codon:yes gene_type:complete
MAKKKYKTLGKLKQEAQKAFNKFIRSRDSDNGFFTCISCGLNKTVDQMDAGHFYPVKGYDGLRYNEDNVHGECKGCNGWDQMHLLHYQPNLIEKVGEYNWMRLIEKAKEYKKDGYKFTRFELEEIKKEYTAKVKEVL